jgi:hypothetical protein
MGGPAGWSHMLQLTISPLGNAFAAKVVVYRDGTWQASPPVDLEVHGDVFSMSFPSGNRYDGMHLDHGVLKGSYFRKSDKQTVPVEFTRQP